MKVVILAGGKGTRFAEQTNLIPKPMIEIGDKPILWHIMKIYYSYGFSDFYICLGYKGNIIKEYFKNYFILNNDLLIDNSLSETQITIFDKKTENWKIHLVDTGIETQTGGRLKKLKKYLKGEEFMLTYGDGLSNINIKKLISNHKKSKKLCTVSAVKPQGRFGALDIDINNQVKKFVEKPKGDSAWINGGFFVCENKVLDFIDKDSTIFEKEPLENLAKKRQLNTYKHEDFWSPMDTLRDHKILDNLWKSKNCPWRKW